VYVIPCHPPHLLTQRHMHRRDTNPYCQRYRSLREPGLLQAFSRATKPLEPRTQAQRRTMPLMA
jgi:hypothetical protein